VAECVTASTDAITFDTPGTIALGRVVQPGMDTALDPAGTTSTRARGWLGLRGAMLSFLLLAAAGVGIGAWATSGTAGRDVTAELLPTSGPEAMVIENPPAPGELVVATTVGAIRGGIQALDAVWAQAGGDSAQMVRQWDGCTTACWPQVSVPAGQDLLVAIPVVSTCDGPVTGVHATFAAPRTIQITLVQGPAVPSGACTAFAPHFVLVAVPLGALPSGRLVVDATGLQAAIDLG
jgi:hypothetical protein